MRPISRPRTVRATPTVAHYRWAAVGVVVFTVYGGLLPFHYTPRPLDEAVAAFRQTALWDPADLGARGDWVVSVGQYAVLGFALMAAACCDRRWWAGLLAAPVVAAGAAAVAVGVEFLQLYFPPRTVSLNDIVVESAGGAVGAVAWVAVGQRVTGWARRLEAVTSLAGLGRRLLPAYVVALVVAALMPFDFVVGRAELAAKAADGRVRLVPFADGLTAAAAGKAALTAAAFAPLGLLTALARRRSRQPGNRPVGLGPVLLAPAAIEALKLFVYSRTFDAADIVAGTAGVLAGWRLGWGLRTAPLAAWAFAPRLGLLGPVLGLAWLGAVLYANWRPFDFTTDPAAFAADAQDLPAVGLRHFALAPFVDYYWNSKYNALDRFLLKGLSFLPLGVLLAVAAREIYRPATLRRAVGLAAAAAVLVEAGRYFLPSHLPSVTDVLIQTAGAWLGFRLTRFVRATLWAESALYGWLRPAAVRSGAAAAQPQVLRFIGRP
ncbi:MAG TPA: VanZ family protein [Gemmataceae bacterium]